MMRTLLWIWCFPQMLAGYLVRILTRAVERDGYFEYNLKSGSVSLGEYIFICPGHVGKPSVLKHEQGHRTQSRMLGWLYLPVIGIPSIVWAGCFEKYRKKHGVSYYAFYTEKWADKLGGVER